MTLKVYKSSAGSGKTSTLVIEYLSLALINPFQFRQIIALTFTQKATNEMKNRLINNLVKLKEMDVNNPNEDIAYIITALKENTGFDENKIKHQSKLLLSNILHQYGDFGFNTIDSFVVKIVRSFAHNLQLAANFEIELDNNILIEQAIEQLYENVGKMLSYTCTSTVMLLYAYYSFGRQVSCIDNTCRRNDHVFWWDQCDQRHLADRNTCRRYDFLNSAK